MEYFMSQKEFFLKFLKETVEIESPSASREATNKLSDHLARGFQEIGAQTKILDGTPQGDHLLITYGEGSESILLLGHMDTVWQEGTLQKMPFRVEGDKVSGPGIFDMKTGLAMVWLVFKAFKDLGEKPRKKIIVLFTSDEEIGSLTSKKYITEYAKDCKTVLVMEPSEKGALKTFRKGIGAVKVNVKGKAAHAGLNHDDGISAIKELANLVLEVEKFNNKDNGTTVNTGVFHGGTASNVVPAEASAEIDFRFSENSQGEKVENFLKSYKPQAQGAEITISGGIDRGPLLRTDQVVKLFQMARSIATTMNIDLQEISVGGASDGNLTSAMGVPTLDGLGAVGEGAHAEHEHIVLTESLQRTALLYKLLLQL
jgi:glutamate carboxypeptidase